AAFREAVLCQPETAEMHLALGEALAEAGKIDEGLPSLETAARLARPEGGRPKAALQKWRGEGGNRPRGQNHNHPPPPASSGAGGGGRWKRQKGTISAGSPPAEFCSFFC